METHSLGGFRFGPFELRPATRELFKHGMRIKLPPQAFEVLRVLLERKGELVTRQEFHGILWSVDTFVDFDQGLNNAIKRIREVLNDSAESPQYVETLPRLGYRFIGEIDAAAQPFPTDPAPPTDRAPDLTQAKTAEPQPISPPEPPPQPAPPRKRPRPIALLAAAVVLGSLAVAWFLRPHYPRPRITGEVQLTSDGLSKRGPIATDGLRVYFTESVNGVETIATVSVTGGQVVPLKLPFPYAGLYGVSPDKRDLLVAGTPDMYQEAPLWRVPIIGGTPRRLGNIGAHDASWSPDGSRLAYVNRGGVYLANGDGSQPRTLLAPRGLADEWAWHPRWSPDGKRLRFDYYEMAIHACRIWEVNTDGSNPHPIFTPSSDSTMQAGDDWTSDGKYSVFTAWKDLESSDPWPATNLWAMREKTDLLHRASALPEDLTVGPIRFGLHTLSLDGKTIFALSSLKHGELMRYDAHTRSVSLYDAGMSAEGVTFSRDGTMVAYVKYPQGELWRNRIDGSEALQLSSRPLFAANPAWSPDGRQIAFNGIRAGENWRPYLVSAAGGEPRRIDKIGQGIDPTWSPDGNSLVFGNFLNFTDHADDYMIRILNLQTGNLTPVPGSGGLTSPRISPNGRWIVAISTAPSNDNQKLLIFDMQTRTWRVLAAASNIDWPQWSRDGRYVYFKRTTPNREIVRVGLTGGKPETIASLKGLRTTGVDAGWFSLTPDGDVLFLHDTGGGTEIYALSWDAP
jgi:Tol biopolymer transport system component/DNA-binding winged helix-turn-helix (wHTH) protein